MGRGYGKKREVKFPAIYFVWLIGRKGGKMGFFQVVLARIMAHLLYNEKRALVFPMKS